MRRKHVLDLRSILVWSSSTTTLTAAHPASLRSSGFAYWRTVALICNARGPKCSVIMGISVCNSATVDSGESTAGSKGKRTEVCMPPTVKNVHRSVYTFVGESDMTSTEGKIGAGAAVEDDGAAAAAAVPPVPAKKLVDDWLKIEEVSGGGMPTDGEGVASVYPTPVPMLSRTGAGGETVRDAAARMACSRAIASALACWSDWSRACSAAKASARAWA